jgi:hypothetical protein
MTAAARPIAGAVLRPTGSSSYQSDLVQILIQLRRCLSGLQRWLRPGPVSAERQHPSTVRCNIDFAKYGHQLFGVFPRERAETVPEPPARITTYMTNSPGCVFFGQGRKDGVYRKVNLRKMRTKV